MYRVYLLQLHNLPSVFLHVHRKTLFLHFMVSFINMHISYLPWNRGFSPNIWSFIDNTPKLYIWKGFICQFFFLCHYPEIMIRKLFRQFSTVVDGWDIFKNIRYCIRQDDSPVYWRKVIIDASGRGAGRGCNYKNILHYLSSLNSASAYTTPSISLAFL